MIQARWNSLATSVLSGPNLLARARRISEEVLDHAMP